MANDNACRLLGYSSHDLIGQKLTQFFLKPDCNVVEALSEEHVEADGRAAVVFGTVVSVGLASWSVPWGWTRTPQEAAAAGLALLVRECLTSSASLGHWKSYTGSTTPKKLPSKGLAAEKRKRKMFSACVCFFKKFCRYC